jgi:hypothetical protein
MLALLLAVLRLEIHKYHISRELLTYAGNTMFSNATASYTLLSSCDRYPAHLGNIAPPGTLLICDAEPGSGPIAFDSHFAWNGQMFYFSPKTVLSRALLQTFLSPLNISQNSGALLFCNLTLTPKFSMLEAFFFNDGNEKPETFPFVYRTLHGNVSGISHTIIRSNTNLGSLELFEPFPEFCFAKSETFKTNCTNITMKTINHGNLITVATDLRDCDYEFGYFCRFLHWSQYPPNPERGFVLGPIVIKNETGNLWFGNAENLVLPTPDFSMVYNTPMIVGLFFSGCIAMLLRLVSEKKTI